MELEVLASSKGLLALALRTGTQERSLQVGSRVVDCSIRSSVQNDVRGKDCDAGDVGDAGDPLEGESLVAPLVALDVTEGRELKSDVQICPVDPKRSYDALLLDLLNASPILLLSRQDVTRSSSSSRASSSVDTVVAGPQAPQGNQGQRRVRVSDQKRDTKAKKK